MQMNVLLKIAPSLLCPLCGFDGSSNRGAFKIEPSLTPGNLQWVWVSGCIPTRRLTQSSQAILMCSLKTSVNPRVLGGGEGRGSWMNGTHLLQESLTEQRLITRQTCIFQTSSSRTGFLCRGIVFETCLVISFQLQHVLEKRFLWCCFVTTSMRC